MSQQQRQHIVRDVFDNANMDDDDDDVGNTVTSHRQPPPAPEDAAGDDSDDDDGGDDNGPEQQRRGDEDEDEDDDEGLESEAEDEQEEEEFDLPHLPYVMVPSELEGVSTTALYQLLEGFAIRLEDVTEADNIRAMLRGNPSLTTSLVRILHECGLAATVREVLPGEDAEGADADEKGGGTTGHKRSRGGRRRRRGENDGEDDYDGVEHEDEYEGEDDEQLQEEDEEEEEDHVKFVPVRDKNGNKVLHELPDNVPVSLPPGCTSWIGQQRLPQQQQQQQQQFPPQPASRV